MADDPREAAGHLLRAARESLGLSVREAGRRAGFSSGYWHQLETGYRSITKDVRVPINPRTEKLYAAAAAVSVDVADLLRAYGRKPLTGREAPPPAESEGETFARLDAWVEWFDSQPGEVQEQAVSRIFRRARHGEPAREAG